jgi:hypothetical protein
VSGFSVKILYTVVKGLTGNEESLSSTNLSRTCPPRVLALLLKESVKKPLPFAKKAVSTLF